MGRMGLLRINDADAVVGEVLSPKTFYAVAPPRKTGIMATQTLNPANENVPAGYYAVTTLSAVDGDLASPNIKATITIFGFAGSNDVRDISDADLVAAEAPTGKFFYAVSGGRKTGSGTKTLNPANETVNAGYYAATTLSAVDGDLAVGNIKSGVTIFGFLGTFVNTIASDVENVTKSAELCNEGTTSTYYREISVGATTSVTIMTQNNTHAVGSRIVAVGFCLGYSMVAQHKIQLVMGGTQVAEGAYTDFDDSRDMTVLIGTRVMSGSQDTLLRCYHGGGSTEDFRMPGNYSNSSTAGIGIGVVGMKLA